MARRFGMIVMAEAVRSSTFIGTLPTMLRLMRGGGSSPAWRRCSISSRFWSGLDKLEELDLIRPGEIGHVHFQDAPDLPRGLLDDATRLNPGDGIAPVERMLRTLAEKGCSGPLSVELFRPEYQKGDPSEVAREIRQKSETVMRRAGVMYAAARHAFPPQAGPELVGPVRNAAVDNGSRPRGLAGHRGRAGRRRTSVPVGAVNSNVS